MRLRPIEHLEKPQNAHTRKTDYTFFVFYNWSTKKTEQTVLFKTKLKPNRTETEPEKSIPHIPKSNNT